MSTTKYISWGQVKKVEAEKARRAQQEPTVAHRATVAPDATDAAGRAQAVSSPSAPEPLTRETTVAPDATVARPATVAPSTIVPGATVAPDHGSPWHRATVAPDATVAPLATVKTVAGYWNLSNTVVDSLWQVLDPYQCKVYLRLLRLSRGYKRDWCRVGYDRLAQSCKMSKRKVQDVIAELGTLGLIEDLGTSYGGSSPEEKGTKYRVIVPGETVAPGATVAQESTVAPRATVARGASMKGKIEKEHERAPAAGAPADVFEVRRLAAKIREIHHGEFGYTPERFRADVRTALVGAGREADDETIDEATRGMV
jgi:hypothetical protein